MQLQRGTDGLEFCDYHFIYKMDKQKGPLCITEDYIQYLVIDLTFFPPLIIYLYIFITIATLYHDSWILIIKGKQKKQIIEKFITHQQNRLWVSKSYITNLSRYKL